MRLWRREAELRIVGRRLHASYPDNWTNRRGEPRVVSVLPEDASRVLPMVRGPISAFLGVLFAAVGLVLLIACSNVASLLLARANVRRREIAVRMALGAGRARLVRQLLTESLLLSVAAGVLGLALAALALKLILAFQPPLPFSLALGLELDRRVALFALALSLATGVAFGLLPALRASGTRPIDALKARAGESPRRRALALRDALVVAQVAGSLVLLVGAGLFLRSLSRAQAIDPGFDPERALVFSLDLAAQGYDATRGAAFYSALQERLAATPGVTRRELLHLPAAHTRRRAAQLPRGGLRAGPRRGHGGRLELRRRGLLRDDAQRARARPRLHAAGRPRRPVRSWS